MGEPQYDVRIAPGIYRRFPDPALFAFRAGSLLRLPVDVEAAYVIGVLGLGLPSYVGSNRTYEIYLVLQRALHQEVCVHVASVSYVFFGQQTAPVETFVNLLRLCDIGEMGRGTLGARYDTREVVIAGFGEMQFVATPGLRTLVAVTSVRIVRRVQTLARPR